MTARPMTRDDSNAFIEEHHRHHGRVSGFKFAIGAEKDGQLVGVAVAGRPVARMTDQKRILEVTRLATDGQKNACSFLYARAAQAAKAMGYDEIQTFILKSEDGASLKAAGWEEVPCQAGGSWDRPTRRRTDKHPTEGKRKFRKVLNRPAHHEGDDA